MKRFLMLVTVVTTVILYACNDADKKSSENNDTPATGAADTATAATTAVPDIATTTASAYDPDPTDTIPAGAYTAGTTSEQTAGLVKKTIEHLFASDINSNIIDSFSRRFIFFEYDLNNDGKKEIFVGLRGPYFCGSGGCTQLILDDQGNLITRFSVAGYPVIIDNNQTNGWNDLIIYSGHKNHIVKFDGKKYPSNPSLQPQLKVLPGDGLPRALNFIHEPYPWFRF